MLPPLFLLLLILLSPLPQSEPLTPSSLLQLRTLVSVSHSLLLRVANARSSRGDRSGAHRVRTIAEKLQFLGPGAGVWSLGWDYAWNYAWRGISGVPMEDISKPMGEFIGLLRELGRLMSDGERARWAVRNSGRLISLADDVLHGFQRVFLRSGPLRDMVMILQKEVVEGNLVRDCLDVGVGDLEGLATIARDLLFTFTRSNGENYDEL